MGEISYIRESFQLDKTSVVMCFLLAGWTLIPGAKEESVELVRSYLAKRNTIKAHLSKPNGASSRGGHLRCREPRLAASFGSTGFLYQSGHAKKKTLATYQHPVWNGSNDDIPAVAEKR